MPVTLNLPPDLYRWYAAWAARRRTGDIEYCLLEALEQYANEIDMATAAHMNEVQPSPDCWG